jgi:hypothetical protein
MDWVEDEVVLVEDEALHQGLVLELVRAEALHRVPGLALDRVLDLALAQAEAPADPVVVVAEERPQQPWAHRTRSVREVKRRR